MNTPKIAIDAIRPMLEDKVFCDLGCGDGEIVEHAAQYARRSFGMQWSNDRQDLDRLRARGVKFIEANILDVEWPAADVYYCFTFFHDARRVLNKHQRGILVIGGTPEKFEHYPSEAKSGTVIDIPTGDPETPVWRLAIFTKRPANTV